MNEKRIELMRAALQEALRPSALEITDESHKHIGHEGAKSGKGHFHVRITADRFEGLNAVRQHQLIYQALGDLMETDIHALSIEASAASKPDNS